MKSRKRQKIRMMAALFLFCLTFRTQPVSGDAAVAEDPQQVQAGDLVKVRFSVTLEDGRLVRTNRALTVKSAQARIPLFATLQGTEDFTSKEIIAGSSETLPGAPALGGPIIGLRAGEKKILTLAPEKAYGVKNPELIKTFKRHLREPRTVQMGPKEFFDQFNGFPVAGQSVNLLPYFPSRIVRVQEQTVTLQAQVTDGARLRGAYGTASVRFEKEALLLTVNPMIGAPYVWRDLTGKILYADADEFSVDFNPLPVGEKVVLEVEVVSLIKASAFYDRQLPWRDDYAQGLESAKQSQKPTVLVLYEPGCHFCEQLMTESLADPRIQVLEDQFIWVRIDSSKETALFEHYKQEGYPLTVLLDKEGQEIGRIDGYKPAGEFRAELDRVLKKAPPPQARSEIGMAILGLSHPPKSVPLDGISLGPDMQTPILKQPDGKNYHLFFTGIRANTPPTAEPRCATLLLKTKHFLVGAQYRSVVNANGVPQFVLKPTCNCPAGSGASSSSWGCRLNPDANYAGLTAVFPAGDGKTGHLIGIYHCQTDTFKEDKQCFVKKGFFAQVCLARSQDGGKSWVPDKKPIIAGEPMPNHLDLHVSGSAASFVNGTPQPAAIQDQVRKYIYVYYPYIATGQYDPASGTVCASGGCPKGQQGTFQVARATVHHGKIGPWKKFYLGRFDHPEQPAQDQPGLWGQGDSVVPDLRAECEFARQPGISYNTYLHAYVMTFICRTGWYFSTATDLEIQNWTAPQKFYEAPCTLRNPDGSRPASCGIFTEGNQTDENLVLVTRGNPSNQTTGQTGLVLYASTPAWGSKTPHTFYARKFTFTLNKGVELESSR